MKIKLSQLKKLIKEVVKESIITDEERALDELERPWSVDLDWTKPILSLSRYAREFACRVAIVDDNGPRGFPVVRFAGLKSSLKKLIDDYASENGEDPEIFYAMIEHEKPVIRY